MMGISAAITPCFYKQPDRFCPFNPLPHRHYEPIYTCFPSNYPEFGVIKTGIIDILARDTLVRNIGIVLP